MNQIQLDALALEARRAGRGEAVLVDAELLLDLIAAVEERVRAVQRRSGMNAKEMADRAEVARKEAFADWLPSVERSIRSAAELGETSTVVKAPHDEDLPPAIYRDLEARGFEVSYWYGYITIQVKQVKRHLPRPWWHILFCKDGTWIG